MGEETARLRCKHGRHVAISEDQSRPFGQWFGSVGLGGFRPFSAPDDSKLPRMVEALLERTFKRAHVMQADPKEYTYEERVAHVMRYGRMR